jgi:rare lipoprotein A
MSLMSRARTSLVDIKANPIHLNAPSVSVAGVRTVIELLLLALGAASLAACAQSSVVTSKSQSLEHHRTTSVATNRNYGVASFYTEGTQTANGESFDTLKLTAAHRTLPFGTRLRVTNVATGRSVTVRVNDRGPFVSGRVVDVTYAAAEALGMVRPGVAKVKIDILR